MSFEELLRSIIQEEVTKINALVAPLDDEEILTAEEAMTVLKCTPDVLKKYRSEGMPYIMGSPHRYIRGQIMQWIKTNYVIRRK